MCLEKLIEKYVECTLWFRGIDTAYIETQPLSYRLVNHSIPWLDHLSLPNLSL